MSQSGPFSHMKRVLQSKESASAVSESSQRDLPPLFQFSQNSLQDYVDCARRFQLRYIEGRRWPAAQSKPIQDHEQFVAHGVEFHLLAQRHLEGIPADLLTPQEPPLSDWWQAYLQYPPRNLPATLRIAEAQLSVPIGGHRLMAKFDLLAIEPGERAVIVDWKTSRKRPERHTIASRLQSRVYPCVLAEAGGALFGGPLKPEQISLIYWFANERPAEPETFSYSQPQHEGNRDYLSGLVAEITGQAEEIWPLTWEEYRCKYCIYRSLCERGIEAGSMDDAIQEDFGEDFDFDLDLEMVDEIAF